jgi:hypothetical protein
MPTNFKMATKCRLIRPPSPPEPITPPPNRKHKHIGVRAFANMAMAYYDRTRLDYSLYDARLHLGPNLSL